MASDSRGLPPRERYRDFSQQQSVMIIQANKKNSKADVNEPKLPMLAYAYIQDRFELSDIVLNIGVRFDYFDTQSRHLRDPLYPYILAIKCF
ncbi:MAG: hypothetical protein IPG53_13295 [Ignavibacteriales bacterium]|nr:hypothetical protein [Ignavibacteriales bacterium]